MNIAIIGAGFSGLSGAKVLNRLGHDVTVYEKAPDVGGVWSRTRRYPGVTTQNNKDTYYLPDFPMPDGYPEWPSGEQVQRYLADYVEHFGLSAHLRLDTEVVRAHLDERAGRWYVTSRDVHTGERSTREYEHLVVANGIFCEPFVPGLDGASEFRAAGGHLCHASELHELDDVRGKDVIVLGYGKSSCDVAAAVSDHARSTTVVARDLLWKLPKRIGNLLNYKYLMLTRLGEGLFPYIQPNRVERFLHGPARPVRNAMLGTVRSIATWQCGLRRLGLVPQGGFERIARSTVSLVTDGFFERVADGRIAVRRDCRIAELSTGAAGTGVELTTGERLSADIVVCGTGFRQSVPFFDSEIRDRITDERGNFRLYRQIRPVDVPRLSFSGYNSSFFSPLSSEIAALWIACDLADELRLPAPEQQRRHIERRLRWMEERTWGKHARGTNIIPFSMHNVDEMLSDIGLDVGPITRALQWLLPVRPSSYRDLPARLERRQRAVAHG